MKKSDEIVTKTLLLLGAVPVLFAGVGTRLVRWVWGEPLTFLARSQGRGPTAEVPVDPGVSARWAGGIEFVVEWLLDLVVPVMVTALV